MSRLRSFTTLVLLAIHSQALPSPLADVDEEECWYDEPGPQPVQHAVSSSAPLAHISNSPPSSILAPYEHRPSLPSPHPSPSQVPHATLPVPAQSHTLATVGTVSGIVFALAAVCATARYFIRRRRLASADPFEDPPEPRPGFAPFLLRFNRSASSKKRLSDESWVSPNMKLPSTTPSLYIAAPSLLPHDFELRSFAFPTPARKRKLIPVTTPVCTPSDTVFGSRLHLDHTKDSSRSIQYTGGSPIHVPSVRVPSPAYISPFSPSPSPSPSPSLASDTSTLSPTPSIEPLALPLIHAYSNNEQQQGPRLSRLLSSSFQGTRTRARARARADADVQGPNTALAHSTTAELIQTARTYAHAYRPSSATSTSLYTPPHSNSSLRLAGARSRPGFYPNNGDSQSPSVGSANSNETIRVALSYTEGLDSGTNIPYTPYSPWRRARDTLSTVTTSDTVCTVPHLLRAASDMQMSTSVSGTSPFADPPRAPHVGSVMSSASMSSLGTVGSGTVWPGTNSQRPVGTPLGLTVRLSDASEHEHYRAREKERQTRREREREPLENIFSPESSSETRVLASSPTLESFSTNSESTGGSPSRRTARGGHRRSKSLTRYTGRRVEREVRRHARGAEISVAGGSDDGVEHNLGMSMHERTESEPESMQAKDERDHDEDDDEEFNTDDVRHTRTSDKRRTRIAFKLRDSESVLREIGW